MSNASPPSTLTFTLNIFLISDLSISFYEFLGIYKVNYDEKNWKLLITYLQTNEYSNIPILNRVQLLSDAADLAFNGNLKYDIFFELLEYLTIEEEYLPWKAALSKTSEIGKYLKKSSFYEQYKVSKIIQSCQLYTNCFSGLYEKSSNTYILKYWRTGHFKFYF